MAVISIEISDDELAVLKRAENAGAEAVETRLAQVVDAWVRSQLNQERYAKAEQRGNLYTARYWRYGVENNEQFLTPDEAARFLARGADDGDLSWEGVFDPSGNDMEWDYMYGWRNSTHPDKPKDAD